ncbi:M protein trans-acting positive regulator [Enterococcus faecalis 13-SD-W-01]|nr:M protein trans-acting positive regulator [Enterococcus faecalis 13-SD-W-01]
MKIDYLLEEEDREKLLIVRYLEFEKNNYLVLPRLYEVLGLSKFKTRNYIIELNKEFAAFDSHPEIIVSEDGEIEVKNLNMIDIKNLRRVYFAKSKIAQLLTDTVTSKVTIDKFAEEQFLSTSRAYVKRKELTVFLEHQGIKLKKNTLVGKETAIRSMLFSVYFGIYNGYKLPFDEKILNETKNIVQYFEYLLQLKLSSTKKIKLNLLVALVLLRAYNGDILTECYFHPKYFETIEGTEIIQDISRISFKNLSKEQILNEVSYILLFLIGEEEFAHGRQFVNEEDNFQEIDKITQVLSSHLFHLLPFSEKVPEEERLKAQERLTLGFERINRTHQIFDFRMSSFISKKQMQFFFETYPIFSSAVKEIVDKYIEEFNGNEELAVRLFYDYLFLLIDVCPVSYFEPPIHVCIDFSQGKSYTNYIVSQVNGFKNYNIVIESKVTSKTHIYLSDCLLENFGKKQIIWKEPPTPDDWENFGNAVIKLKSTQK